MGVFVLDITRLPIRVKPVSAVKHPNSCVTSGFRRDVDEICALLGCYAEYSAKSAPTFSGQPIGRNFKVQEAQQKLGVFDP